MGNKGLLVKFIGDEVSTLIELSDEEFVRVEKFLESEGEIENYLISGGYFINLDNVKYFKLSQ